jgi:hypothetical protein
MNGITIYLGNVLAGQTVSFGQDLSKYAYAWTQVMKALWAVFGREVGAVNGHWRLVAVLPKEKVENRPERGPFIEFRILVCQGDLTKNATHEILVRFSECAQCQMEELIKRAVSDYFARGLIKQQQQLVETSDVIASLPFGAEITTGGVTV